MEIIDTFGKILVHIVIRENHLVSLGKLSWTKTSKLILAGIIFSGDVTTIRAGPSELVGQPSLHQIMADTLTLFQSGEVRLCPPTVFWMGFYTDISWESRCSSKIKVWGHLSQILVVFEVPGRTRVKGMSWNSKNYQNLTKDTQS